MPAASLMLRGLGEILGVLLSVDEEPLGAAVAGNAPILMKGVTDGLYATGPVFALCQQYGWKFMITLTDAQLASVNEEFEALASPRAREPTSPDDRPERPN